MQHFYRTTFVALFLVSSLLVTAQANFSSQLPLLVIDTDGGGEIRDEPKIDATLKIIDNPSGVNRPRDPGTDYVGPIGIELRGSSSQSFPKKGYGFELREADGGDTDASLLGMPEEEDWILHGPYSDKSLVRNALAYRLAERIMPYAPRTRLTEVVINGDYRGVYLLTERIKRDDNRVDIAKLNPDENTGDDVTGGYILKLDKATGEPGGVEILFESAYRADTDFQQRIRFLYHYPRADRISDPQKDYIQNWMADFEDALAANDWLDPVTGYRQYVDLQSFVDFFIINELSRNVDGYRISTYFYKDKESNGGKLHMGPVWDFNLGFGNADYCRGSDPEGWAYEFPQNCPEDFWQVPFWWQRLRQDPEFQRLLAQRWTTLRDGPFSNGNLNRMIDSLVNEVGMQAIDRNFNRFPVLSEYVWPNAFVGGNYNEELLYLKNWVRTRAIWMDGNIETTISTGNPVAGRVVNFAPNPTRGPIRMLDMETQPIREVRVYDAYGRMVHSAYGADLGQSMDLSTVAPGVYTLTCVTFGGERLTSRVVRQ